MIWKYLDRSYPNNCLSYKHGNHFQCISFGWAAEQRFWCFHEFWQQPVAKNLTYFDPLVKSDFAQKSIFLNIKLRKIEILIKNRDFWYNIGQKVGILQKFEFLFSLVHVLLFYAAGVGSVIMLVRNYSWLYIFPKSLAIISGEFEVDELVSEGLKLDQAMGYPVAKIIL